MRLDQVAQVFIQLGLENLKEQSLSSLSGSPIPVLKCPHEEGFSLYQCELLFLEFTSIVCCPPAMHHSEKLGSVSFVTSH